MIHVTVYRSLVLLRVSIAAVFFMHALVRLLNHSMERFAGYLEQKGLVYGMMIVWLITIFELLGGLLLALGFYTKQLALCFIALLLAGIVLIHFSLGWFVGEHGTGGMEYSFILIVTLITIIAANNKKSHP